MNRRSKNLSGNKFGKLKALYFIDIINGRSVYKCQCDCGTLIDVKAKYLCNGDTQSCGCLKKQTAILNSQKVKTHGLSKHPIYKVWSSMKDRCLNIRCHAYADYGGRGITVASEWMDFATFYNDVSPTYRKGLELDRFPNNNAGYNKLNFRWTTPTENKRNRRTSINLQINGISKPLTQWAQDTGISRGSLFYRFKNGLVGETLLYGTRKLNKTQ